MVSNIKEIRNLNNQEYKHQEKITNLFKNYDYRNLIKQYTNDQLKFKLKNKNQENSIRFKIDELTSQQNFLPENLTKNKKERSPRIYVDKNCKDENGSDFEDTNEKSPCAAVKKVGLLRKLTQKLSNKFIDVIFKFFDITMVLVETIHKFIKNVSAEFSNITTVKSSSSTEFNLKPTDDLLHDIFSIRMLWILLYWIYFVFYESGFTNTIFWISNESKLSFLGYSGSANDLIQLNKSYGTTLYRYKIDNHDVMWWYLFPLLVYLYIVCTTTEFCRCIWDSTVRYSTTSVPAIPKDSFTTPLSASSNPNFNFDIESCEFVLWLMNMDREEQDCSIDLSMVTSRPTYLTTNTSNPSVTPTRITNMTNVSTINSSQSKMESNTTNLTNESTVATQQMSTIHSTSNQTSSSSTSKDSGSETSKGGLLRASCPACLKITKENKVFINNLIKQDPMRIFADFAMDVTAVKIKHKECKNFFSHPDNRDQNMNILEQNKVCGTWSADGFAAFKFAEGCCSSPPSWKINLVKQSSQKKFAKNEMKVSELDVFDLEGEEVVDLVESGHLETFTFNSNTMHKVDFDKLYDGYNIDYFEVQKITNKVNIKRNEEPIMAYKQINVFNLKHNTDDNQLTCIVPQEYYQSGIIINIRCLDREQFKFITDNSINKRFEVQKVNQNRTQFNKSLVFACIPLVQGIIKMNKKTIFNSISAFHFPQIQSLKYEFLFKSKNKTLKISNFWTILPQTVSLKSEFGGNAFELDNISHSQQPFSTEHRFNTQIITISGEVIIKQSNIVINDEQQGSFDCIIEKIISNMTIQCFESSIVPKYTAKYQLTSKDPNFRNRVGIYLTDEWVLNENNEKSHQVQFMDTIDKYEDSKFYYIKKQDSEISVK